MHTVGLLFAIFSLEGHISIHDAMCHRHRWLCNCRCGHTERPRILFFFCVKRHKDWNWTIDPVWMPSTSSITCFTQREGFGRQQAFPFISNCCWRVNAIPELVTCIGCFSICITIATHYMTNKHILNYLTQCQEQHIASFQYKCECKNSRNMTWCRIDAGISCC